MARSGTSSQPGRKSTEASIRTRQALIEAAIETLKTEGFAGASARAIAARASSNQALIFYHFGSVADLLLAALDVVSADRLARYGAAVAAAATTGDLVDVATAIFTEDLDHGYAKVLVEMIAGASSTPGLGPEVAARVAPWARFAEQAIAAVAGSSPLAAQVPTGEVAYGVVALYLGIEMLSHLDGDRTPALALFDQAKRLVTLGEALGLLPSSAPKEHP